jgi:hypothetical protein
VVEGLKSRSKFDLVGKKKSSRRQATVRELTKFALAVSAKKERMSQRGAQEHKEFLM